ncbi:hypothetical protein MA16_Dca028208 [Dendrobium catenatum]|uniref:Uncharacterized protein n=1 Tax=Dendrobium catenatum TaxID=906689 RepID=A0A2I0VDZ5_9ASPA|nr:hypothetical protein MA16_Dca028208 [Dendrobium catenatum]
MDGKQPTRIKMGAYGTYHKGKMMYFSRSFNGGGPLTNFRLLVSSKASIFSCRRTIDGWKYMIEVIGPNAKRRKEVCRGFLVLLIHLRSLSKRKCQLLASIQLSQLTSE